MNLSKLQSRKFHVFLVWIILVGFSIFRNNFDETMIQWFGLISLAYIGSNSFQKYIEKK